MNSLPRTKIEGLTFLKLYHFNVMDFWLLRNGINIPNIAEGTLVNIRSLKYWDRKVSIINAIKTDALLNELISYHREFIIQLSYPREWNYSTNTIRIVDGRIINVESVICDEHIGRIETRDIADSKTKHIITLPRWRALRSDHLFDFKSELIDLEILLNRGIYIVEFNTVSKNLGPCNSRIVFWEIICESFFSNQNN